MQIFCKMFCFIDNWLLGKLQYWLKLIWHFTIKQLAICQCRFIITIVSWFQFRMKWNDSNWYRTAPLAKANYSNSFLMLNKMLKCKVVKKRWQFLRKNFQSKMTSKTRFGCGKKSLKALITRRNVLKQQEHAENR